MIEVVKSQLDVGLVSEDPAVVDFWRDEAGLVFDHSIPVVKDQVQYRFDERGTVVKVNVRKALTGDQRSGIQALLIARDELDAPREMADPDGNRVVFVPTGTEGVTQIGVRIAVRDLARTMAYYRDVLGFTEEARDRVRCGDSVLLFEERDDAPSGFAQAQRGWLYLTVQIRDCDAETARVEEAGGEVVVRPMNLGEVARMAMVRDPDGNLLEISQRAQWTGPLPDA
ncbi:MAG: VOC family protein [bacterium]|nr:VOC family protein [bacterium]